MKPNLNAANISSAAFWATITSVSPRSNEADVELQIVLPLLYALGFSTEDIGSKVPVQFNKGTKLGRPFEADFVAYSAVPHDRNTSLLVIEAKAPGKSLDEARKQGESYASALHAPALLLTDGISLEVWQIQPTLENKKIFECALSCIKTQRGKLEQVIGKNALIAHAATLAHKKLTTTSNLFAYESAEIARTCKSSKAIERILRSEQGFDVKSNDLLDRYSSGAIIVAPSGYGKTTLATGLLRQAIERRMKCPGVSIPVDIPLIDLDASELTLIDFVHARVTAHAPQITMSAIQDLARHQGLLLLCDGYELLAPAERRSLESQMRKILRDYPKSQLFIFSRGSVAPQLSLPRLQLKPLDHNERHLMARIYSGGMVSLGVMPRLLVDLSEIPLLLERIIAFWVSIQRFPTRLEELFEHWLTQLLGDASASPTATILRGKVLTAIARELSAKRLTPEEALEIVSKNGGDSQTFDALVHCGALLITVNSVEFVHEGLADHLRARALAAMPLNELRPALSSMNFDEDSLLPVLLVAQVTDLDSSVYIWERLRDMSLARYIDAIRFSERTGEPFKTADLSHKVLSFTKNMAGSIEALIDGFFPAISAELRGCLANRLDPVEALCLVADITPEPIARLTYALQPNATNTVKIGTPSFEMFHSNMNLTTLQIGIYDGRYVGAIAVRDALSTLVQQRRFIGKKILANERTIGRLRFMEKMCDFPVDPNERIVKLISRLVPIKHMCVNPNPMQSGSSAFSIESLVNDLDLLRKHGDTHLDWWWLKYGAPDQLAEESHAMEAYLQEHYNRMTALYSEIVNASFGHVSSEFSLMQIAPIRWKLAITPSSFSSSPTQHWHWMPVSSEIDGGVDVTFSSKVPEEFILDSAHDNLLVAELDRLGRSAIRYTTGGSGEIPSCSTHDWRGRLTGETSAMRGAMKYLEEDIEFMFRDLTVHHLTLGDIPSF